jgi:hypothetical protein
MEVSTMLRLAALLSVIALIAGCQTPGELKASRTVQHEVVAASGSPVKVAACLQRTYENMSSLFATRLTPLGDDAYELVVREDTFAWAVLEIRQGVIEYWVDPTYTATPREHVSAVAARCR